MSTRSPSDDEQLEQRLVDAALRLDEALEAALRGPLSHTTQVLDSELELEVRLLRDTAAQLLDVFEAIDVTRSV